jgi:uncharacterized LabA/DUF88 family protein
MPKSAPDRVIVYIDGFNLYFGLRDANYRRFYWLNLNAVSQNLLRPGQQLAAVKYFTARISGARHGDSPARAADRDAKRQRQSEYLEALGTLDSFSIFEGHYQSKPARCNNCGATWVRHEEKMTDVQIATQLLTDAFQGGFDRAIIVSADSDLVPPVNMVRSIFPDKRIIAVFPPKRFSDDMRSACHGYVHLGRDVLKASVFPDCVSRKDGRILRRPTSWA